MGALLFGIDSATAEASLSIPVSARRCGDLLVAQPLNVGVIHDVAALLWQRLHGRLDVVVRQQIQCSVEYNTGGATSCGSRLVAFDIGIGQNSEQPGVEIAARLELVESTDAFIMVSCTKSSAPAWLRLSRNE
jgi:hypothetical protein